MDEQYKDVLIKTINTYPKYRHEFIYKKLNRVLHFGEEGKDLFQDYGNFVRVNKNDNDLKRIICAIEQNEKGIIEILKTEFFHSYKYATLLEIKKDHNKIKSFFTTYKK